MIPELLSTAHTRRFRVGENGPVDTASHERLLLLELATDLQNWPARNMVFRQALDRAAHDLVRLARESSSV